MAIYIHEEKENNKNIFGFLIVFIILIVLGISIYYIFFIKPDVLNVVISKKLSIYPIDNVANMDFNPMDVVNSSFFKSLKQLVPPKELPPAGNSSPFGVF